MPSEWHRVFLNFFLFWKRVLAEKGIAIGIERSLVETQLAQRHLVKIRDLILFWGSRWNLVQNCRRSWFEWVRLSEAVPSLMTQSWPWGSQLKKNCFFVIVIKTMLWIGIWYHELCFFFWHLYPSKNYNLKNIYTIYKNNLQYNINANIKKYKSSI